MDGGFIHSTSEQATGAAALLSRARDEAPRVHCITNAAAQVFTANLLLAAGAIPSLTVAADEIGSFVARATGLLVNLGTLDAERCASIPLALQTAQAAGKVWVLDPVFVEASPPRLAMARGLLGDGPTILRCNAGEFGALSGRMATEAHLHEFAAVHRCVVALTGPVDIVSDGTRCVRVANGHPLMSRTTAMGCAGTALIAAFAGLHPDPFEAASAALLVLGVAGEIAAARANGPGSFVPEFLDALAALDAAHINDYARISS
jgi:hydroxyethylthiazole kinase